MTFVAICFALSAAIVRSAEPTTKPSQTTITLDAYWLRLTPAQLAAAQSSVPAALLTDEKVLYAQARVVSFDGEVGSADVKHTARVVTGATPVVAPGVSTYSLETTEANFGVLFSETPNLMPDQSVKVAFESKITMMESSTSSQPKKSTTDPSNPPYPLDIDPVHGTLDGSTVELRAQSSVSLKPGVAMVVSGMSDHPGDTNNRTLCLVLRVTVGQAK